MAVSWNWFTAADITTYHPVVAFNLIGGVNQSLECRVVLVDKHQTILVLVPAFEDGLVFLSPFFFCVFKGLFTIGFGVAL